MEKNFVAFDRIDDEHFSDFSAALDDEQRITELQDTNSGTTPAIDYAH